MKICIYGAGAIGGYMGAELARSGADVSLVARGPHLAAMRKNGLKLRIGDEEHITHPKCTDNPTELGPQDFIIVTLKAHSVPSVVEAMQPLLGDNTAIVTAVNGVPWWYFYNFSGAYEGQRILAVDPGNVQWNGIGPERAIGCVVYPACEIVEPGIVQHISGNKFTLGEPSGERTQRVETLSQALISANMKAPVRPRIRDEIWIKLWGNLSFNPISSLTSATLEEIAEDQGTRSVISDMMTEAQAVGEALGVKFPVSVEKRINGAGAVGAHKTSMLQDLELGRPMEIDALVAAVSEMGTMVGVETPTINIILALVQQRARVAGCY